MNCKICGRETYKTTEKNSCEIFHCPACNFYFSGVSTTPEYYDKKYWDQEDAGWKHRNREEKLKDNLKGIHNFVANPKKILDFGCGFGDFVEYLRRQKIDAYGCDPFPDLPKKKYLAPDHIPWLHLYDVITMIEVLEHLPNPLDILRELHECTKKKGILYIQTAIWDEDMNIQSWWYVNPPNHCNYFTTQSMEKILSQSGWKVEYMRSPMTIAK